MRVVVSIDGDLIVPQDPNQGIPGQRTAINRIVAGLGELLRSEHELVITYGNSPQIGYVLLRAEIASHVVHSVPLDVCGSDTQGATGYLLQQALHNWMQQFLVNKEVVSLVTQVLVDMSDPASARPTRGIGPFFDRDKAQLYANTRNWDFVLIPGRGYRRAVPSLKPRHIMEVRSIQNLLAAGTIVICAGGGGVPVCQSERDDLVGIEAVIDKAYTAALLATEIGAQVIIFVSTWDKIEQTLGTHLGDGSRRVLSSELGESIKRARDLDEGLYNKFIASQQFLQRGGQLVLIAPPGRFGADPQCSSGIHIVNG